MLIINIHFFAQRQMLRKDKPLQVTVKLPSIHPPRPQSGKSKTSSTCPSSQPKSNTSNLQKLLFQKLDDYDVMLRKQKKQDKLDKKVRKPSVSRKSQQLAVNLQGKYSNSKIEDIRLKAKRALEEKNTHSLREIKLEQKEKPQQTFITRTIQNQPNQSLPDDYEDATPCPYSLDQIQNLYDDYRQDNCYIDYTPSSDIKQMMEDAKRFDTDMDEIQDNLNKLIKMVGFAAIPKDLDQEIIQQQEGN